jgi:hypothetical protein
MTDLIPRAQDTLSRRVWAIQDPTPEFAMRHFVVGQHDTPGQRWAQAVLELDNRLMALAVSDVDRRIAHIKIDRLERRGGEIAKLKADKIRLELAQLERATLGAERGIAHLLKIIAELESDHNGHGWTREELDAEQREYWHRRLSRQALQDLIATGRIGVGNQEALWQIGRAVDPPQEHVAAVERRFLENGNVKILVATPTLIEREMVERKGLDCLSGWEIPNTLQRKYYAITGRPVGDAYNEAARVALEDGADFMLCVEDDHRIPAGTFERIWKVFKERGPRAIVAAWYPQKRDPRTGAAVVLRHGKREYLHDDGNVHEVYSVPQGFTLVPTAVFREIAQPWFATTGCLTQDSFFSQLAREAGYSLLVDTSARIKHVCRDTGRVFE